MLDWFRDRLRNGRPWFRWSNHDVALEGERLGSDLILTIRNGSYTNVVKLNRESTDKLVMWLLRVFPGDNNVVRLPSKIPLREAKRNTEGSPPDSAG